MQVVNKDFTQGCWFISISTSCQFYKRKLHVCSAASPQFVWSQGQDLGWDAFTLEPWSLLDHTWRNWPWQVVVSRCSLSIQSCTCLCWYNCMFPAPSEPLQLRGKARPKQVIHMFPGPQAWCPFRRRGGRPCRKNDSSVSLGFLGSYHPSGESNSHRGICSELNQSVNQSWVNAKIAQVYK